MHFALISDILSNLLQELMIFSKSAQNQNVTHKRITNRMFKSRIYKSRTQTNLMDIAHCYFNDVIA